MQLHDTLFLTNFTLAYTHESNLEDYYFLELCETLGKLEKYLKVVVIYIRE